MISIKAAVSNLEQSERLRNELVKAYRAALGAISQYAIEVETKSLAEHQRNLSAIESKLGEAASPEQIHESTSALRGELREYRDRSVAQLSRLRTELENHARMLESLTVAMVESGADQSGRASIQLRKLRDAAEAVGNTQVRTIIRGATEALEHYVEHVEKEHQFYVAQLTAEIQVLHRRVEQLQLSQESGPQVLSHSQAESKLEAAITDGRSFSIILFRLRNLQTLVAEYGAELGEAAVSAFTKRLRLKLGPEVPLGLWTGDQVLAILAGTKADAIYRSRDLLPALVGAYSFSTAGSSHRVILQVESGVAEFAPSDGMQKILATMNRLAGITS